MSDQQKTDGKALARVNLMLTEEESIWLDELGNEIREHTGAKVSRSEIVRVAISTLAEIHRLERLFPERGMPLHTCKNERELSVAGVLAVRRAALP